MTEKKFLLEEKFVSSTRKKCKADNNFRSKTFDHYLVFWKPTYHHLVTSYHLLVCLTDIKRTPHLTAFKCDVQFSKRGRGETSITPNLERRGKNFWLAEKILGDRKFLLTKSKKNLDIFF